MNIQDYTYPHTAAVNAALDARIAQIIAIPEGQRIRANHAALLWNIMTLVRQILMSMRSLWPMLKCAADGITMDSTSEQMSVAIERYKVTYEKVATLDALLETFK